MSSETSQYEITRPPPLMAYGAEGIAHCTDIGVARVVKTMLGKTRIRVTYAKNKHSILWALTVLALTLVANVAWLEESALLQPHSIQPIVHPIDLPEIMVPTRPPATIATNSVANPPAAQITAPKPVLKQPVPAVTVSPSMPLEKMAVEQAPKPTDTEVNAAPKIVPATENAAIPDIPSGKPQTEIPQPFTSQNAATDEQAANPDQPISPDDNNGQNLTAGKP